MPGRNLAVTDAGGVTVANAVTVMAFPPVTAGVVSSWTTGGNNSVVPEFDLEIWSDATVNLTLARLYGGIPQPLVLSDKVFTAANATEIFTSVAHTIQTGDGPFRVSNSGGALPAGLVAGTDYWGIRLDADTFHLALTQALALGGAANKVAITTDGTGTQTLADVATTERVHWHSYGLLGDALDGAIGLTSVQAYLVRCRHHPRAIAYAVSATMSAANATTVNIYPIQQAY